MLIVTQGFFYNKFPQPKKGELGTETDINLNQQLCYHVLGQPQSKDSVVWACPDHPAWMLGAEVTDDGRYPPYCTLAAYCSPGQLQPPPRVTILDMHTTFFTAASHVLVKDAINIRSGIVTPTLAEMLTWRSAVHGSAKHQVRPCQPLLRNPQLYRNSEQSCTHQSILYLCGSVSSCTDHFSM